MYLLNFSHQKTRIQFNHCGRILKRRLEPLNPKFISVTYGAGGSTRENTHNLVKEIKQKTSLEPAAHLTVLELPKDEIEKIADDYWDSGVTTHIVALRGDKPKSRQHKKKKDFLYATDLIKVLKKNTILNYCICIP